MIPRVKKMFVLKKITSGGWGAGTVRRTRISDDRRRAKETRRKEESRRETCGSIVLHDDDGYESRVDRTKTRVVEIRV